MTKKVVLEKHQNGICICHWQESRSSLLKILLSCAYVFFCKSLKWEPTYRTKVVFCRNGYEYTDVYVTLLTSHVSKLLRADTKNCILDGEMMGWNKNLKCYKYKGKRRIILMSVIAWTMLCSCLWSYDCRKSYTYSLFCVLSAYTPYNLLCRELHCWMLHFPWC